MLLLLQCNLLVDLNTKSLRKHFIIFFIGALFLISATQRERKPKLEKGSSEWIDSVFNMLTPQERIGQLFMVAAYSNQGEQHKKDIALLIEQYNLGGLIFFQGGPYREAELTNYYQSIAKVPLMIAMDAEWGLGMRLDSTMNFPKQMTLGAIQDNQLIYDMGVEIGYQCRRLGIHVNFAPVVDINVNANNPVIGTRSFGENKVNVAEKGSAYMRGMQSVHVLACAKHFPGHGDTDRDSHKTLPVINHTKERLERIELYPFRQLIEDSVASIMVAHLNVPKLDDRPNTPTTLSSKVITDLLKVEMRFGGLIFTDALNMRGVADHFEPGEMDVKALLAGNDVLLYPMNVPKAVEMIQKAVTDGKITQSELDNRVKKILLAKYWAGLYNKQVIDKDSLYEDLNNPEAQALNYKLFEKALTVAKNEDDLLPIRVLDTNSFASVMIGDTENNVFQNTLDKYATFQHTDIAKNQITQYTLTRTLNQVKDKKIVVVGLGNMTNSRSRQYGISSEIKDFLKALERHTEVVVVAFGNPYSLQHLENIGHVICAYERNDHTEKAVPQLIFGAIGANGKLPVSASKAIPVGTGIETKSLKRLGYDYPENHRIDGKILNRIDSVAMEAIKEEATPGCQVLVARHGKIVFSKSYGHLTYEKKKAVTDSTLYDIASITKVAVSTQLMMWLRGNGLIHPDDTISTILPELKGTNKELITIREVMAHQAGLFPFIPYWERTKDSTEHYSEVFYNTVPSDKFCYRLNDTTFICSSIQDSVFNWTLSSRLISPDKDKNIFPEKYSDVGYYLLKQVFERITGDSINYFYEENFSLPLGLNRTLYNPLRAFDKNEIAPTEKDSYFRNQLVWGTVHDQGAALMGGVAGHAGLFSTTLDLAKLGQMNLNQGYYGGTQYLNPEVLEEFTSQQFVDNRKGMGWDRVRSTGRGNTSEYSSEEIFGHTGFTGTSLWMDPKYDLVYVFLSNRVYPEAENKKLLYLDIRTRIHDLIYESMVSYNQKHNPKLL